MLLLIISFLVIAAYTAAVCIKAKGVPYQCNLLRNRTQRMVSLHNVGLSYGVNAGDIGGQ